ncbi:hypothetical protein [Pontixanthobacter sp. CEM42]|nr:hypothetical protein [Pontixanthobacter sp. CEM42]
MANAIKALNISSDDVIAPVRAMIVSGCGLALIFAGTFHPF